MSAAFKQQPLGDYTKKQIREGESYEILVQVHIEYFINNCIFQNNSGNIEWVLKSQKKGQKRGLNAG